MNKIDAANILGLSGSVNASDIKKAYRKAASKFHPDVGGSDEMMQAVNAAYEALKGFEGCLDNSGDFEAIDYGEKLNEALSKIIALQGLIIEVCGAWVWVSGETKTHKEELKAAGFFYARKKIAWYFRPNTHKSRGRGRFSMDDIREMHGSEKVAIKQNKKLAA